MTTAQRVSRVRLFLASAALLRAIGWAFVAAASVIVGAAIADAFTPLGVEARGAFRWGAALAWLATALVLAWRDRAVFSLDRIALWIEERFPSLEFALVAALERNSEVELESPRSAPMGSPSRWTATAARRALRAVAPPLAAVLVAALVMLSLPRGAVARIRSPRPGDALDRAGTDRSPAASRLTPLVAQVIPPHYTGRPDSTVDEPSDLRALAGSTARLRGAGDPSGIIVTAGGIAVPIVRDARGWSATIRVGDTATVIRLADRDYRRLIALEPIVDREPTVDLVSPAHDTVFRAPTGAVALAATADDDIALASAGFEYIVSSGEGETFKFRSGTLGARRVAGLHASLAATIQLQTLGLSPGDVVHLRAVARDANDVTGPGAGASETRTIRIARAGEYDSTAVNAAAPSDEDKSVISERMLITLAEALERKRASLSRPQLVAESQSIAADQTRLRRSVGDVVFARLGGPSGEETSGDDAPARARSMQELLARADSATNRSVDPIDFAGGESPVVAINKPLLEAYNAMWDASTELGVAEPGRALPHMRRALEAIELARRAERVYLRGAPLPVVIDLARVRLAGSLPDASPATRPAVAVDSVARTLDRRFVRIVELAARNTSAGVDSLLVLRIDALASNAPFAAAIADAASALRRGDSRGATAALVRARRTIAGPIIVRDSLTRWSVLP
jgi:hypothetical protein